MIPDDVREAWDYLQLYIPSPYIDGMYHGTYNKQTLALITIREWFDSLPQVPEPDWTDAPEWAQWWSCDAHGACRWQEKEPRAINNTWISDGQFEIIRNTPDWRTTLQSRPEEDDD